MKRLLGYSMICIAVGIFLRGYYEKDWLAYLTIAGLLCMGYYLLCKCK